MAIRKMTLPGTSKSSCAMIQIIVIISNLQLTLKYAGNVALVAKNHVTARACQVLQLVAPATFIIYIGICLAILSGQAVSV